MEKLLATFRCMSTHPTHKAAEIFPLMEGRALEALVEDIRKNGQLEPITLYKGEILDGRNRYLACRQLGLEPRFSEWQELGSPAAFVISRNLHRRHLTEGQRAMIGARLAPNRRGENLRDRKAKSTENIRENTEQRIRCSSDSEDTMTVSEAADALNIGTNIINDAKTVLREGTPEQIAAVDSGDVRPFRIAEEIRKGCEPEKPAKKRTRSENAQIKAGVWKQFRIALDAIRGLPMASDVAAIAAEGTRKATYTDEHLSACMKWMEEFQNEWRNRRGNAS